MDFDSLHPFKNKEFFEEVFSSFKNFKFKLFGTIDMKLEGEQSDTELDINLGKIHFTEQDFQGLNKVVEKTNKKWKTKITFCIFTSDKTGRDILINVRSPAAPMELD